MSKNCKNNTSSCCSSETQHNKNSKKSKAKLGIGKLIVAIILTIVVCVISMVPDLNLRVGTEIYKFLYSTFSIGWLKNATSVHLCFLTNILLLILTIPVQFVCGWRFIVGTGRAIKTRQANMNVLVFIGTTIAFLMSLYITFEPFIINNWSKSLNEYTNNCMPFYETCCMLVTFIYLGQVLEDHAKNSTRKAVEGLKQLVPDTVNRIVGYANSAQLLEGLACGHTLKAQKANIEDINPLDFVLVLEGQSIPVDGMIIGGKCQVDESMITGESDSVTKSPGEDVVGGTKCISGKIIVQVVHEYENSVLAKIINSVESAQNTKAPVARVADKVAGVFVPLILICALLSYLGWFIYGYYTSGMMITSTVVMHALMCGVSVSVVSCACALGLATPTALAVGMGKGAQLGIVIKDGAVLETMCKLGYAVFDKTGTLTLTGLDKNRQAAKIIRPEAKNTINELQTTYSVQTYLVSGDNKQETARVAHLVGFPQENVVYGVQPVDKKTFIDKLMSAILASKSKKKKSKKRKNDKVAFVGDGINDAPALASADIGITLESGTDIALDSGNVVLMHNDLSDICTAIRLSKATMKKIKQNLFWALIYNIVMVPLAAFGILLPALAACCHAISSILVIVNSLTLKKFKK